MNWTPEADAVARKLEQDVAELRRLDTNEREETMAPELLATSVGAIVDRADALRKIADAALTPCGNGAAAIENAPQEMRREVWLALVTDAVTLAWDAGKLVVLGIRRTLATAKPEPTEPTDPPTLQ